MSIYPFPGPQRLTATSWPQRLRAADTEQEVVDVARDFLATFSPYDFARLPDELRPGRLVDGNDVSDLAFTLVRHAHDRDPDSARCIHRLTTFFSQAAVRLSDLKGRSRPYAVPRFDGPTAQRPR